MNDLRIPINPTGEAIDDMFANYYWIEEVEFADTTVWNYAAIYQAPWFRGTAGADTLTGTSGDDTIYCDAGDDTLSAGAGDDTFVFKAGFGNDTVNGFAVGALTDDVLEFDGVSGVTDFASVLALCTQVGSDTVIDVDASNSINLSNVSLASLREDDFRFV